MWEEESSNPESSIAEDSPVKAPTMRRIRRRLSAQPIERVPEKETAAADGEYVCERKDSDAETSSSDAGSRNEWRKSEVEMLERFGAEEVYQRDEDEHDAVVLEENIRRLDELEQAHYAELWRSHALGNRRNS